MNRGELTTELARRAGLGSAEARRAVRALFGTAPGEGLIADALDRGEKVTIAGFGTFGPRERAARRVRDPRTGEPREVPAARVASFRAGVALRDRLR